MRALPGVTCKRRHVEVSGYEFEFGRFPKKTGQRVTAPFFYLFDRVFQAARVGTG
ncbi:hypothetical protein [Thalassovita taeanensis]|uniref:Uncharacterized protein n=1 Tax=Thalassovita taeanensis TaxID=657014 RepID=A0A1H9JMF3_9RHOB|nr:hypothetical protein [Thalassovita taeanensis]SEQ87990.1 hypothetical protein SAMN04488092_11584 [Thalassovita taeanensis]